MSVLLTRGLTALFDKEQDGIWSVKLSYEGIGAEEDGFYKLSSAYAWAQIAADNLIKSVAR